MAKQNTKSIPYKTGDEGYNRKSGRKTLLFVLLCIILVVIFSILSFVFLFNSY